MKERLAEFRAECESLDATGRIAWALEKFGAGRVILASSFSFEDQVVTDLLVKLEPSCRIFTLDTGRQFEETYEVWHRSRAFFKVKYEVMAPDPGEVAALVSSYGPNLFYESVEKRKMCCEVRKVKPLKKVLHTVDLWICGLRREQSVTRTELAPLEWDAENNIFKLNPICEWTFAEVKKYVSERGLPYNSLHDKGYPSIGCAPCTRAVMEGEDARAGRWWWESAEGRECGLHVKR